MEAGGRPEVAATPLLACARGSGHDDRVPAARPAGEAGRQGVALGDGVGQGVEAGAHQYVGTVLVERVGRGLVGLGLLLGGLDRLLRDAGLGDLRLQAVDLGLCGVVEVEHRDVELGHFDQVADGGADLVERLLAEHAELSRRGVALGVHGQRVVVLEHAVQDGLQVLVDQRVTDVAELAVVAVQLVHGLAVDLPLDVDVGARDDLVRDAHLDAVRALLALVVGVGLDRAVHDVRLLPRRLEVRAVGEVARGRPERGPDGDVLGGYLDEDALPDAGQAGDDADDGADAGVPRVSLGLVVTPVAGAVDDLGRDLEGHTCQDEQHDSRDEPPHSGAPFCARYYASRITHCIYSRYTQSVIQD